VSLDFELPRFGISLVTLEPERLVPVDAGAANGPESPPAGLDPGIAVDRPIDDATGSAGTGDAVGVDTPAELAPTPIAADGAPTSGTTEPLPRAMDGSCIFCGRDARSTVSARVSMLFAVLAGFALRRRSAP
jgi:hypothetical protein